jgi:hypothetical protein
LLTLPVLHIVITPKVGHPTEHILELNKIIKKTLGNVNYFAYLYRVIRVKH